MESVLNREEFIDSSKGIGIILVILGHCLNKNYWPFHIIFTFHMPLFFFLSGMVSKVDLSFLTLIKKRVHSLVVPYFCFFVLGLLLTVIVPDWLSCFTLQGVIKDFFYADPENVHNSSIWFLICLFGVQLLFLCIAKLPIWIQLATLSSLYVLGSVYIHQLISMTGLDRLPMNIDVVPVAVFLFAMGYYAKESINSFRKNYGWMIIVGVGLVVISYRLNGYVNLHGLNFGNPVLYLIGGLGGSIMVIGISLALEHVAGVMRRLKLVVQYYGNHSLIILGVQSLLIRLYVVFQAHRGIELKMYDFPKLESLICFILVAFVEVPVICFLYDRIVIFKKGKKQDNVGETNAE